MANRLLFRIEGTMGSPAVENFSIGVNYAGVGGSGLGDAAVLQDLAQSMADFLETGTSFQAALDELSTGVFLTRVSTYGYQGTGPAAAAGQAQISPGRQGSGTIDCPFQVARVISLLTGLPGARNRGRIYVPALSAGPSITGKSNPVPGYLAAWKVIFDQVATEWTGSAPIELGVYSASNDTVTPVTQLRAGDVLDTQRRRRDGLSEVYTTLAY